MSRKKRMVINALLLFALGFLTVNLAGVSSLPESPYIMVLPETTLDPNLTPGMNYEVSIYTDYDGSDVWSWQFALAFNSTILEGVSVSNGDLITQEKNPDAYFVFEPGTFDNTAGTLSLTSAYYDFVGTVYDTTYGPGTLAYVTFEVKSYGSSDAAFDITPDTDTALIGAIGKSTRIITSGFVNSERIGNGYFSNRLIGDADGNRKVDALDLQKVGKAYESTPTQQNWNSYCDFNHDFAVNRTDLSGLRDNYGNSI